MTVAIVKYNAGNVRSVAAAISRLGVSSVVTDDPSILLKAQRVIFPGVGEASSAISYLRLNGLDRVIRDIKAPFLGICLGMQLMCRHSEEGDTHCINILDINLTKFDSTSGLKVPHMGWNSITNLSGPLFNGIQEGAFVYFVHSFQAPVSKNTIAQTQYGATFSAAIHKENFFGLQFHVEKSGDIGAEILKNFMSM